MIADHHTNTVCLSNVTKEDFPEQSDAFLKILNEHGINTAILNNTEDYFCRDFMPIQVSENDFVQFVFRPQRHFKKHEYDCISNPVLIELTNNNLIQSRYSALILDGGNVVKWENKAIITDRVYSDNLYQFGSEEAIKKQLEKDLQCEIIIIPEYPGEPTGHADGLIRFINGNTVFINDIQNEPEKQWLHDFSLSLENNGLSHIELPCPMKDGQESAMGLYINYLHVGKIVIVPQFGLKKDDNAINTIQKAYGNSYTIIPFEATWIGQKGGVFNCCTWSIKT